MALISFSDRRLGFSSPGSGSTCTISLSAVARAGLGVRAVAGGHFCVVLDSLVRLELTAGRIHTIVTSRHTPMVTVMASALMSRWRLRVEMRRLKATLSRAV